MTPTSQAHHCRRSSPSSSAGDGLHKKASELVVGRGPYFDGGHSGPLPVVSTRWKLLQILIEIPPMRAMQCSSLSLFLLLPLYGCKVRLLHLISAS
ncbi:hypothetical protein ZWY2020_057515 [Hordeum vulgare]|nr:hypothetical protein ZWY2020_057515 [Hordeum vulgare]